jgi:hypothetical protein
LTTLLSLYQKVIYFTSQKAQSRAFCVVDEIPVTARWGQDADSCNQSRNSLTGINREVFVSNQVFITNFTVRKTTWRQLTRKTREN